MIEWDGDIEYDNPDDLSRVATSQICDAGHCVEVRAAIVLTADFGWLPMCKAHAIEELTR